MGGTLPEGMQLAIWNGCNVIPVHCGGGLFTVGTPGSENCSTLIPILQNATVSADTFHLASTAVTQWPFLASKCIGGGLQVKPVPHLRTHVWPRILGSSMRVPVHGPVLSDGVRLAPVEELISPTVSDMSVSERIFLRERHLTACALVLPMFGNGVLTEAYVVRHPAPAPDPDQAPTAASECIGQTKYTASV